MAYLEVGSMASQEIDDTIDTIDPENMQTADYDEPEQPSSDSPVIQMCDFSTKTWREDMALVVEGRKLFVASNILSLMSPVFTAMFEEQFKEEGPREIELKNEKFDDVAEFLRCLYPNISKKINQDNVFAVLPLADEFKVKQLKKSCEDFLVDVTDKSVPPQHVCKYLQLAFRYNMKTLRCKCVKIAAGVDQGLLSDAEKIHPLPLEIRCVVQARTIRQFGKNILKLRQIQEEREETCRTLKYYLIYDLVEKGKKEQFRQAEAGALKLLIANVSTFHSSKSRKEITRGIGWYISASRTENEDKEYQLGVYLNATAPSEWYEWASEITGKIMLLDKNAGKHHIKAINKTFSPGEHGWGYSSFISIKELTSEKKYVVDDTIEINVYFLVKEPVCKPNPETLTTGDDDSVTDSDTNDDIDYD